MARISIPYIRFSTLEQQQGGSLERQRRIIRDFSERNGWTISDEFFDRGKSAFTNAHRDQSAELGRLEREARDGLHFGKTIVVEKLDRLSRLEPMATIDLIRHFLRCGVDVAAAETGFIYKAGQELPTEQIYPLVAEADAAFRFSKTLQSRISLGFQISREKARANGTVLTRRLPLWLTVDDDNRAILIPERANIMQQIFEMADEGMGTRAIVRQLEAQGVKTFGTSKVWQRSYVIKILQNRAVVGEFQPTVLAEGKRVAEGEPWQGHFPAVVTEAIFARVNAASSTRARAKGGRSDRKFSNLFSGLAICRCCGGSIRYALNRKAGTRKFDSRRGTSYCANRDQGNLHCRNARDSGGKACNNSRHWSYLRFEDAVLDKLLHLAMDDQSFGNRGEAARVANLIAQRERELDVLTNRSAAFWTQWADTQSDILKELALNAERDAQGARDNLSGLRQQLSAASGRATSKQHLSRVADIRGRLHCNNDDERVRLRRKVTVAVNSLIDSITFDSEKAFIRLTGEVGCLIVDRNGNVSGLDTFKAYRDAGLHSDYSRRYARAKKAGMLPF